MLATINPFGTDLWMAFVAMAVIAPPAIALWRRNGWRFSLKYALLAMLLIGSMCMWCKTDLMHLEVAIDYHATSIVQSPMIWSIVYGLPALFLIALSLFCTHFFIVRRQP